MWALVQEGVVLETTDVDPEGVITPILSGNRVLRRFSLAGCSRMTYSPRRSRCWRSVKQLSGCGATES